MNYKPVTKISLNLIIDIGNTQTKAAIFSEKKLIFHKNFSGKFNIPSLKNIISNKKIDSAILCSVVNHSKEINKFLMHNFNFIELSEKTKLPIKILYKTPKTLGKDRIANAVGANFLFPNKNVLAIDAGTCIKYDFINYNNEYLGGAISPGINMRYMALNKFTANLPLIIKKNPLSKGVNKELNDFIGQTTSDSVISGVENGVVAEISGIIKLYRKNFENVIVVFTGGDSVFFNKIVSRKNRTFANPDLTMMGLNIILNFNNETK